jgi:hypothetical protein
MENSGERQRQEIVLERIESAMRIVAEHILRHVREMGDSPFTVIYQRLEKERELCLTKQAVYQRAADFLSQSATRESQSALLDNDAPLP